MDEFRNGAIDCSGVLFDKCGVSDAGMAASYEQNFCYYILFMPTDKDNQREARWYELPLKDWVIIGALIGNFANQSATINTVTEKITAMGTTIADMNTAMKENAKKNEAEIELLKEKINKLNTDNEVTKLRLQSLEGGRK